MKYLLSLLLLCACQYAGAQDFRTDTIYFSNKPAMLLKQTHVLPATYTIETFTNETLIRIYPGRTALKGKQYYIVTFVKDGRQALVPKKNDMPAQLLPELSNNKVLVDTGINIQAEDDFIKKHPVPQGYQDVEQIYNY